jgi:YVTN family beta-propeller protein
MIFARRLLLLPLALALLTIASTSAQAPGYHVVNTYALGGEGSWDYLSLDPQGHRLFIARQTRVTVVDPATGKVLGEIPGIKGAHGVALSEADNRGFATSGNDATVVMFDLKTLQVLGRIPAADDADAILFDPASKRIFTLNGDAHSSSVIDPATGKNIGTIKLGGKPEFGVSAGNGKIYANITDTAEVVEIDATAMSVTRRWPVAPCGNSTGLAIDVTHNRLFSVCRSKHLAVSDIQAGKLVTTVPIGGAVDAAGFDPATQLVFASNGDGTLTVVHEETPDTYSVVETVPTGPSAKTMALDPATHRVYLGTRAAGSFQVLVLDRK